MKIGFKKNRPMVKPTPCPNAFASLFKEMMLKMATINTIKVPSSEGMPSVASCRIPPTMPPIRTIQNALVFQVN